MHACMCAAGLNHAVTQELRHAAQQICTVDDVQEAGHPGTTLPMVNPNQQIPCPATSVAARALRKVLALH